MDRATGRAITHPAISPAAIDQCRSQGRRVNPAQAGRRIRINRRINRPSRVHRVSPARADRRIPISRRPIRPSRAAADRSNQSQASRRRPVNRDRGRPIGPPEVNQLRNRSPRLRAVLSRSRSPLRRLNPRKGRIGPRHRRAAVTRIMRKRPGTPENGEPSHAHVPREVAIGHAPVVQSTGQPRAR